VEHDQVVAESERFVLDLEQMRELTTDRTRSFAREARADSELATVLERRDANL
jgi:hypothetical protein